MKSEYDVIILGAGFYGLRIAQHLRERGFAKILILESQDKPMLRASYVNQARVHNGYHYPRSILTAFRSRLSSSRFIAEYQAAIRQDFDHVYAVARSLSKTSSRQFEQFAQRIGAPLEDAPLNVSHDFSSRLIEKVWIAMEPSFDPIILRSEVLEKVISLGGIEIQLGQHVLTVSKLGSNSCVSLTSGKKYDAPIVIACLYAGINNLHFRSGLELLPIQYELAELALVQMPDRWRDRAVTIMDGPFFSIMPFPSQGLHTFSHVRYTPQIRWDDSSKPIFEDSTPEQMGEFKSSFRQMKADAVRYMPILDDMHYVKSIRDIKTVLASVELSDRRPVVVRDDFDAPGYFSILGGKIDNVYDVLEELDVKLGLQGDRNV